MIGAFVIAFREVIEHDFRESIFSHLRVGVVSTPLGDTLLQFE